MFTNHKPKLITYSFCSFVQNTELRSNPKKKQAKQQQKARNSATTHNTTSPYGC